MKVHLNAGEAMLGGLAICPEEYMSFVQKPSISVIVQTYGHQTLIYIFIPKYRTLNYPIHP